MVLASCFALSGAMARRRGIDAKPDGERPRPFSQYREGSPGLIVTAVNAAAVIIFVR
jgi:hypothetical protein